MNIRNEKGKSLIAFPDNYIVIDIETTGLDFEYSHIIEIAAIKYSEGIKSDTFCTLVQPTPFYETQNGKDELKFVSEFITDLTGITNDMLKSAPTESDSILKFMDFIGDSILVGHNVGFDINFLYDSAKRSNLVLKNNYIDTLRIARKLFPDMNHHRLSDIAQKLNIPSPKHRALSDVLTTSQCFSKMIQFIDQKYDRDSFIQSFKKQSTDYNRFIEELVSPEFIDETNPFYGKVVVFTGTLSTMTRKQALTIVSNLGGIPANSVTAKTNYLVVGNEEFASSVKNGKTNKMRKADDLKASGKDIETISENTFFQMINE